MSEKKELNEDELNKVNGGHGINDDIGDPCCNCSVCGKFFWLDDAEKVQFGEACEDKWYEYKCPHCGALQKPDVYYL